MSYKRVSLLAALLFFIYFFSNTPGDYTFKYIISIGLWLSLALLVYFFPRGKVQGKLRFGPSLKLWAFNFAVIYIIVYMAWGFIDGFGKSPYSHSFKGIFLNMLMVICMLASKEMFRSFTINKFVKSENVYRVVILVSLLMAFIDIPFSKYSGLNGYKSTIQFAAEIFLPSLSQSLLASYIAYLGGALPAIIYMGVIQSFHWLSPVLPNLKWVTTSLIGVVCPLFCLDSLQSIYNGDTHRIKAREKKGRSVFSLCLTCVFSVLTVWFAAGVFPIYPSVVATGSMKPEIEPGDITINREVNVDSLKAGDIIQFKKDDVMVSHRIIDVIRKDNKSCFRTKGDNNSSEDFKLVEKDDIKGKVIGTIPKAGWITLLIRNKENIPLDEAEF